MNQDSIQRDLLAALLWEIGAGLRAFAETGATATIDLGGLPLGRADRAALDDALGRGEVAATLDAAGSSDIWETAYSGVWRVRHHGAEHAAVDQIEIAACPKILFTDRRDAGAAARRLDKALGNPAYCRKLSDLSGDAA